MHLQLHQSRRGKFGMARQKAEGLIDKKPPIRGSVLGASQVSGHEFTHANRTDIDWALAPES